MFRPSQRRADPRSDPCYAWGLKESWTRKETERVVAVRRRTDRILGIGIEKNLSDLPNATVTYPKRPIAYIKKFKTVARLRALSK